MYKFDHYRKKINYKKAIKDIILIYIIAVIVVLIINSLFFQAYKIHSNSMEPQIKDNNCILVNKFTYGPKYPFTETRIFNSTGKIRRGDVILFMSDQYIKRTNTAYRALSIFVYTISFTLIELPNFIDNKEEYIYIKRVIGLPGDVINYKKENDIVNVYINGKQEKYVINKKYSIIEDNDKYPIIESYELEEDEYYVLGDNRIISSDSRIFGGIKSKQIIGKAIVQYYPGFKMIK